MSYDQFKETLSLENPPANISPYLKALWFDANGNWEKAHTIIQDIEDSNAAWIHAYLHRKEGDTGNADYWYHRAGRKRPSVTLEQEWESVVKALL
jgi:hypothetical protein